MPRGGLAKHALIYGPASLMLTALALYLKGCEQRCVSPGPLINEFPLRSRSLSLSILAGTRKCKSPALCWPLDGLRYVEYFALRQNFLAINCRGAFAHSACNLCGALFSRPVWPVVVLVVRVRCLAVEVVPVVRRLWCSPALVSSPGSPGCRPWCSCSFPSTRTPG